MEKLECLSFFNIIEMLNGYFAKFDDDFDDYDDYDEIVDDEVDNVDDVIDNIDDNYLNNN